MVIKWKYLKSIKYAVTEELITIDMKIKEHDFVTIGVYAANDDATVQLI